MHGIVRVAAASLLVTAACAAVGDPGPPPPPGAWRERGALSSPGTREHDAALASLLADVRAAGFTERTRLLEDALDGGARFTAEGAGALLEAGWFSDRLEALERLRRHIVDPENGYEVVRRFWPEYAREEAARLLLATPGAQPLLAPTRGACAALATGAPPPPARGPEVLGCTVGEVLALFQTSHWTDDRRFELLRRTSAFLVDRQEAYRLVQAFSFDDDRRRAWRLLF